MVKQKKVSEMKTSEILDKLSEDLDDSTFTRLDEELNERVPFMYLMEIIKTFEDKIEKLESNFSRHLHIDGKLVKEI